MIIGVDIGKSGGIAIDTEAVLMHTYEVELEPAIYQFALKDGKKQMIKSGPNKGQYKKKLRRAAKTTTELDVACIQTDFMCDYKDGEHNVVVLEKPGNSQGNSARSTATTFFNFGKLHACAELAGADIYIVPAAKWKKDLGLSKDKLECVEAAERLSGLSFRGPGGGLRDGPAEAWLIRYWYIKFVQEVEL